MDESIKCECGNNTFWWFGGYCRCPKCHNEYKKDGIEYWLRRFNKEENSYNKNWEHFKSGKPGYSWTDHMERQIEEGNITEETFQQISDKGLESLSKDNPREELEEETERKLREWGAGMVELDKDLLYGCHSNDDFIVENAVMPLPYLSLSIRVNSAWRTFWESRWMFENWLNEYKKKQHILFLENHIKFLENWGR